MKYFLILIIFTFIGCNNSNESKAESFYKDGNTEKAIQYYELAIEEGSVTAMHELGFLYANKHQPDKANEYYSMAFENGNMASAEILSSNSLRDLNYNDVIKYAKKFADAGNKDFCYNLGSAYLRLNEYDLAIKYLKMDEESVYIKDPLGQAFYKKGDFVNAEKYWKSAVDNHKSGAVNSHKKLLNLYLEQERQKDYKAYKNRY